MAADSDAAIKGAPQKSMLFSIRKSKILQVERLQKDVLVYCKEEECN